MPTRRDALMGGALLATGLAGCMEQPETGNETEDGTGDQTDGADDGTDNQTDGDGGGTGTGDGTDGTDGATEGDVSADVSVDWDGENSQVTVTLDDIGDADHVDVEFSGDAEAVGRLNSEGDRLVLGYDSFETEGEAENLGFQQEDAKITLPTWSSEVRVVATAYRGDVKATVFDRTDYIGDRFVSAQVSHLFSKSDTRARVVTEDMGTADYLVVEFRGDVHATGRLHAVNDELRLTNEELETLGDAEDTTESGRFDGAQSGDTVSIRVIAVRMTPDGSRIAARNIVTDKTGSV